MLKPEDYEDLLKGRIAEAIVEAIFFGSKIDIARSGFEFLDVVYLGVNHNLGQLPDFTFARINEKNKRKVDECIEVKFRRNGKLGPGIMYL